MVARLDSKMIVEILEDVGEWIRENAYNVGMRSVLKTEGHNVTFKIDWEAEGQILSKLERCNINAVVFTEERGKVKIGKERPDYYIFLDPLDGSKNFVNGIQYSAISMAFAPYKLEPQFKDLFAGYVYDIWGKKCYYGNLTEGVIFPESEEKIRRQTFIIGYLNGPAFVIFKRIKEQYHYDVRFLGCAALDLAYLSMGRVIAFLDPKSSMRIFDVAAGFVLVKMRNGLVCDIHGSPLDDFYLLSENEEMLSFNSFMAFKNKEVKVKIFKIIEESLPRHYIINVKKGEKYKIDERMCEIEYMDLERDVDVFGREHKGALIARIAISYNGSFSTTGLQLNSDYDNVIVDDLKIKLLNVSENSIQLELIFRYR